MSTVALINETGISSEFMKTVQTADQIFLDKVLAAWKRDPITLITTTPSDPKMPRVRITEQLPKSNAMGYHIAPGGTPTSIVSPRKSYPLFGRYNAKAHLIGKGTIAVIAHELIEMLLDPLLKSVSPTPDKDDHHWMLEIADHCYGEYFEITVNGHACVLPNVTLPAYYDLNAKGPYTLMELMGQKSVVTAPYGRTPLWYAYYIDEHGNEIQVH